MPDSLNVIPVEVGSPSVQGARAASMAMPILNEIDTMLGTLATTGKGSSIDLRRTPLAPRDYDDLLDVLGHGELEAELKCLGITRIRETAVPGVWWITHYTPEGHIQGEFIEVTTCPTMLATSRDEVVSGMRVLQSRLATHGSVTEQDTIQERLRALGFGTADQSSGEFHSQPSSEAG